MKKISRRELTTAAVPIFAGLLHLGCGRDRNPNAGSSLEYDIDHLRHVDPKLLSYDEVTKVEISAEKLRGIAAGSGKVSVVADNELIVIDDDRERNRFQIGAPAGCVAFDADGRLFLGFDSHVEVWTDDGRRLEVWQPVAPEAMITSVALTENEVLIADASAKLVHRFDREGRRLGALGEPDEERGVDGFIVPSPFFDLAVGADGFVWVVNPGRHTIENYASDGSLRSSWGESGMEIEGFCGCCNPTHLSLLPDGRFVTAEKGLPRVKVYAPTGRLQAVVAGPEHFSEKAVGLDLAVDEASRILVLDPSQRAVRVFVERQA